MTEDKERRLIPDMTRDLLKLTQKHLEFWNRPDIKAPSDFVVKNMSKQNILFLATFLDPNIFAWCNSNMTDEEFSRKLKLTNNETNIVTLLEEFVIYYKLEPNRKDLALCLKQVFFACKTAIIEIPSDFRYFSRAELPYFSKT